MTQRSLAHYAEETGCPWRSVDRIAYYCDDVLPALAADDPEAWPVRWDHCFRRIAYDAAVGSKWDRVVDRPFVDHATDDQRRGAALASARMVIGGAAVCDRLNDRSLNYRDE